MRPMLAVVDTWAALTEGWQKQALDKLRGLFPLTVRR